MQNVSRRLIQFGTVLVFAAAAACSPGGPPELPDTPEAAAFQMRDGLMEVVGWKLGQMRMMIDGDIPADETVFVKHAEDLAVLSGMTADGFIPGSIVPGSRALPAIWENWNDFQQRAAEFDTSAQSLLAAARSSGVNGSDAALRSFAQTCGNCHRTYRAPE